MKLHLRFRANPSRPHHVWVHLTEENPGGSAAGLLSGELTRAALARLAERLRLEVKEETPAGEEAKP